MKSTYTYQEMIEISIKDLPSNIDYTKYFGQPNKANQYSHSDVLFAKDMCKTVAKNLAVKTV
jgi:hypothetical protein